ncbi:MAG: hypothetical protein K9I59_10080 [Chlorobium sp.]|uniref:hypothetical protein n=1 Tax=Chlorobium sp. TaxID=1095 RepID=UPI001D230BEE|nr:hypothetical protein [Chlorobium sp.]MBN1278836.1 hypothetical protein [Chlorobiaceae bacterium]MCF8217165.1 hypothetical protein [Chlorobium sp.]MCF8272012.1 hypothetical protein [Chlorobium sp.]MCF8288383.1 hypothetical protein [Chlorobium sp.]MCF8291974.1 hypothetical protein [Chlorobium sp.]
MDTSAVKNTIDPARREEPRPLMPYGCMIAATTSRLNNSVIARNAEGCHLNLPGSASARDITCSRTSNTDRNANTIHSRYTAIPFRLPAQDELPQ